MKVKRRTCDGKLPACSQCLATGQGCGGYQYDLIFIDGSPNKGIVSQSRSKDLKETGVGQLNRHVHGKRIPHTPSLGNEEMIFRCPSPTSTSLNRISLEEITASVVWHYTPECELPWLFTASSTSESRICGAWVEVLPSITGHGCNEQVLPSAIKAFAVSILNKGLGHGLWKSDAIQAYGSALRALNKGLLAAMKTHRLELAAAIMCMALAELMFPSSKSACITHVRGVSELMRTLGPEAYSGGSPHKLFIGFRPILIFEAFRSRQSTFLALEEWKTTPFRLHPPSSMQCLLSEAVSLPAALQNVDRLEQLPPDVANDLAHEALHPLLDILGRLKTWNESYRYGTQGPLYWSKSVSSTQTKASSSSHISLWFPCISVANILTHFWAIRVICLVHIDKLASSYVSLNYEGLLQKIHIPVKSLKDDSIELATRICQSMEYTMQDEMKLYGLASTLFPLSTAHDTFKFYGKETEEQLAWCQGIIANLARGGLYLAPLFSKASYDL
ncbi:hypothetical protein B7494_g312 [Chlorociboria aeruginascens]|nr:hypothetical protein B7494_g312 [Chlorociboria aeruginascens]